MARILTLDIENAPNLAYVWRLYDENVSLDLLMREHYILSWAAKWYGEPKIFFASRNENSQEDMITKMHKLLDEADVVIHFNGKRHDIPFLNREFLEAGLTPPAPYKQIDLVTVVRNQFKFPSNRLVYVARSLGLGQKVEHEGYPLWVKCMNDDQKAWATMKKYNIQDVVLTEKLYNKVRPWIKNHPNIAIYNEDGLACPSCGSKQHWKKDKIAVTKQLRYELYQCRSCKTWYRGTVALGPKAGKKYSPV